MFDFFLQGAWLLNPVSPTRCPSARPWLLPGAPTRTLKKPVHLAHRRLDHTEFEAFLGGGGGGPKAPLLGARSSASLAFFFLLRGEGRCRNSVGKFTG